MADNPVDLNRRRIERIERALEAQRVYISRVPDPDNRHRAETNLMTLLEMREALRQAQGAHGAQQVGA